ncbi:LuxR C-terminal-related transcriptional regulator [Streptomyces heilongjiangensis]|uniref:LuxR C-terminal-related transcriptional regulator n=1 Tax=Streptomyces heilongjiangensis TaxID=945052 RepID=A0ABW1BHZ1_9ACTN|nr:LuxR C-terminal-related transcriptional regulator [Streptomyces heilongjiangensis]MDC2951807.1 LuxR C-terminal-related transcriptional regulator [Streptomyces heilongjiangensis]
MNLALASPAPRTGPDRTTSLVGRGAQLSTLIRHASRTSDTPAPAVLLTGPAGIGRSSLLDTFCRSVSPWAAVLEAGQADGTWRARPSTAPDHLGIAPGGPDALAERFGTDGRPHGVTPYQLHAAVVGLARRGPVVLAADDAHLDRPDTLRALGYVLRRAADLPLLLLLTVPTATGDAEPHALTALLTHPAWTTTELPPLTAPQTAELLTRRLGRRPEPALLRRCLEHSAGIPAAVLAFADRHEAGPGGDDGGPRPHGTTPVGRGPLPRPASRVLSAVTVLGCAEPELVSRLTRLPEPAVRRTLDQLTARRALTAEGRPDPAAPAAGPDRRDGAGHRTPLHARAARLLEDEGRPPQEVADVLLRVRCGAAPWMLETLYAAALDADSPDAAVRYLSHALDLGADQDGRVLRRIRARLADTLAESDPLVALQHLGALLATCADGPELARVARRYTDALLVLGRADEAARLLARVLDRPAAPGVVTIPEDRRPGLEAALLLSGALLPATAPWIRERSLGCGPWTGTGTGTPSGPGPGRRGLQMVRAVLSALSGRPATLPEGRPAVEAPLGRPDQAGSPLDDLTRVASALATQLTDRHTSALDALDALDALLRRPARGGPDPSRVQAYLVRALVRCGLGDLPGAERDGRRARDLAGGGGPGVAPAVVLAYVLAQRGATAATETLLGEVRTAELRPLFYLHPLYWSATAAVRRAHGDACGALRALRAGGRSLGHGAAASLTALPWWLEAAELLTEGGDPAAARRVAAAHGAGDGAPGSPRAAGAALLARGLATPGPAGLALLHEACARLADSPARLLRARAEHALGVALLDTGVPAAARPRLRTALDLMTGCGAGDAAEPVRRRLAEAGGRPRRQTACPGDALTERERRVAELAMAGHSNPEIAEALYITRRTVELHLTHTYHKLGVSGREELSAILAAPGAASPRTGGADR